MSENTLNPREAAWAARALKTVNPQLSQRIAQMAGDYIPLSAYEDTSKALWRWCDVFDERTHYMGVLVGVKGSVCMILSTDSNDVTQARIGNVHPIPGAEPLFDGATPRGLQLENLPEPEEGEEPVEPEQVSVPEQPAPVTPPPAEGETTQMPQVPQDQVRNQDQGGLRFWNK